MKNYQTNTVISLVPPLLSFSPSLPPTLPLALSVCLSGPVETAGLPRSQSETTTGFSGSRRHCRSRDEQRRHTITNGVDYGMVWMEYQLSLSLSPANMLLQMQPYTQAYPLQVQPGNYRNSCLLGSLQWEKPAISLSYCCSIGCSVHSVYFVELQFWPGLLSSQGM